MILELLTYLGILFGTLLLGLITIGIIYTRWHYGQLEAIPGLPAVIKPYFVGGSDPFFYNTVCSDEDIKRVKKYGPIYGMYEGREPMLFIADPELIKLILVKDFDHFQNKRIVDFGPEMVLEMMDFLPYEKWKVVRSHFTPQFTTGKIKTMSIQMLEANENFVKKLIKQADGKPYKFTPRPYFIELAVDVIARCVFATKINSLDDPNNNFLTYVKKMMFENLETNFMFTLVQMFPFLIKFVPPFPPLHVIDFFVNLLQNILKTRKGQGGKRTGNESDFVDTVQDLIDRCETDEVFKRYKCSEKTAIAQALAFLVAGFETTSTTLALMCYRLAKNPKAQNKAIEEIDAFFARHDGKLKHEHVSELVYLNGCMHEALRMNPSLIRIERVCTKDWDHSQSGLNLKTGTIIQIPAYAVQYDEVNFPQPHEYKPERFVNKGEVNPYTYLGFGQGPHNCVGLRFARENIQMAMVCLLRNFRVEDTEGATLKLKKGQSFATSFEPIQLTWRKHKQAT